MNNKMPSVYIAHGSPMAAIEKDKYSESLKQFGKRYPSPKAIVVLSAHWEAPSPIRITGISHPEIIYDFFGFPDPLYHLHYPAPGEPALARNIAETLAEAEFPSLIDPERGLDHGAWVPLRLSYPSANLPVIQISLSNRRTPEELFRMGEALAPLRDQGVLLIGSGGIVHNLRLVHIHHKNAPLDRWAEEFDRWISDRLNDNDIQNLMEYQKKAPYADLAVPTTEHFDPLFFVLGAGLNKPILTFYEGFQYGNLSMRSFLIAS